MQGRAYGFVRDDNFDTAPYAGPLRQRRSPSSSASRRSSTSSGSAASSARPISKDTLFFFGGYENFENDATTVLAISDYWRNRGDGGRDSVEEHHAGAAAEG